MKDLDFTLCAWDEEGKLEFKQYFQLTNNHWEDIKKIYGFVKENAIDVVIGHTMATYYYLWPLKYLTKAKIVLEMQGYIEEEAKSYGDIHPVAYWASKIVYGLFYRTCDLITTSSQTSADIISKYNKNTVAIWGGVDTSIFNPSVPPGNFIQKKPGDIIIGYTGNARVWQGLPFLLVGFAKLHGKYPEFKLVLLCSEKKKVIAPDVTYIEEIAHEKVASFSTDCDILVIPRIHDEVNRISFPSKIIEYMAVGKAVVVSATSDAHLVITNGKDGLVFEPGDTEGFIRALVSLRDPALRARLGREAWKTVQNGYTWGIQADIFIRNIKKLFD
jgi:glycosyltransferase involved in cell wall biosynthesis